MGRKKKDEALAVVPVVEVKVAEYSPVQAVLADLRVKYGVVSWNVAVPAEMAEARKARAEIRDWRVGLEKERQRIKADVLERGRLIDTEAKRITAELCALEDPIDAVIKAEEGRKERERAEKMAAEAKRISAISSKISRYRETLFVLRGKTVAELEALAQDLRNESITKEDYEEYHEAALTARVQAVEDVEAAYKERAELDAIKAKMDQRKAEMDAQAMVIAAEREGLERERIAREKKAADEQKKEAARLAAVAKAKEEYERKVERDAAIFEAKRKEQEAQARMLSERRKRLVEEKRETPGKALQDILELAENVAEFPNHQEVRVKIAFIAEASL